MTRMEDEIRNFRWETEGKKPLDRPRLDEMLVPREHSVNRALGCGLDLHGPAESPVTGSCEYGMRLRVL